MQLSVREIALATSGEVRGRSLDAVAGSFTIDSRLLEPGGCFVALRGRRDGHDFVTSAFERGAAVVVVEHVPPGAAEGATVVVRDTATALACLGRAARERLAQATIVGITGSAGKTTTKDLTAAALGAGRRVHASPGSYNNEAGVPLTLLGADDEVEAVVAELGARFPGNIAELCHIAAPHVGVVTNVGLAHAEFLGGVEGVADTKAELLVALPEHGLAVVSADDVWTERLVARSAARVVRVGTNPGADVRVTMVSIDDELRPVVRLDTPSGTAETKLSLRGEHQAVNAGMAVAVAVELGVPVEAAAGAMAEVHAAARRMALVRTSAGVIVLDDAYNANPAATAAALRALSRLQVVGRRVAVLGDMLELGEHAEPALRTVGELASAAGVEVLVAVGVRADVLAVAASRAGVPAVSTARDAEEAVGLVLACVRSGDAVLVKASRAMGLERVVEALEAGAER